MIKRMYCISVEFYHALQERWFILLPVAKATATRVEVRTWYTFVGPKTRCCSKTRFIAVLSQEILRVMTFVLPKKIVKPIELPSNYSDTQLRVQLKYISH